MFAAVSNSSPCSWEEEFSNLWCYNILEYLRNSGPDAANPEADAANREGQVDDAQVDDTQVDEALADQAQVDETLVNDAISIALETLRWATEDGCEKGYTMQSIAKMIDKSLDLNREEAMEGKDGPHSDPDPKNILSFRNEWASYKERFGIS